MNFLYILSKQEFTSLYRFGQIPLRLNQIIETINKSSQEIDDHIFNNFKSLAYFVGDEEYLIISFLEFNSESNQLDIENVSEIIPLTKASKSSLETKFDNRIDFKEPRFENVILKVEEYIDINDSINGARAFCKLSKVNEPYQKLIEDSVITNAYQARVYGIKSLINRTFYTQLLVYERYEFFPNSDLGYFYDAGETFAHFKDLPTFKGSTFYNFLELNKVELSDKSFIEIANLISNAEDIKKFTDQLTSNNIKEYIVAALFQKFKSDLREKDTIIGSDTGRTIGLITNDKNYASELSIAVYLTGAFLGYKKFYDDLYNKTKIKIFKNEILNKNSNKVFEDVLTENKILDKNISITNINEAILDEIISIIAKTSNGQIKLSGDILKEIQKTFKPVFKSKKPTINDILNFIKSEYSKELEIPKKDTIAIKKEPELFNTQ
jgi:hypothetical protein